MMIEHVSDDKHRLIRAFQRVFRSRDPFTSAGQLDMPVRIILYPTYGYHLEINQFQALTDALRECEEPGYFISEVEAGSDFFVTDGHWICETPSLTEYMDLPLSLENAHYSMNGSWGILVSHEDHALLVCQSPFWRAFEKQYPNWRQDQEKFIECWQQNESDLGSDVRWLGEFLAHLKTPDQ